MIYLGDIVAKLDYPDTKFLVMQLADPGKQDECVLVAACTSPDNLDPAKDFTVHRARVVPAYYQSELEGIHVVRSLLHYVACHEVDEKLMCDGNVLFDPHGTFARSTNP